MTVFVSLSAWMLSVVLRAAGKMTSPAVQPCQSTELQLFLFEPTLGRDEAFVNTLNFYRRSEIMTLYDNARKHVAHVELAFGSYTADACYSVQSAFNATWRYLKAAYEHQKVGVIRDVTTSGPPPPPTSPFEGICAAATDATLGWRTPRMPTTTVLKVIAVWSDILPSSLMGDTSSQTTMTTNRRRTDRCNCGCSHSSIATMMRVLGQHRTRLVVMVPAPLQAEWNVLFNGHHGRREVMILGLDPLPSDSLAAAQTSRDVQRSVFLSSLKRAFCGAAGDTPPSLPPQKSCRSVWTCTFAASLAKYHQLRQTMAHEVTEPITRYLQKHAPWSHVLLQTSQDSGDDASSTTRTASPSETTSTTSRPSRVAKMSKTQRRHRVLDLRLDTALWTGTVVVLFMGALG